ncbi:MAG: hypothetical protein LLG01_19865 [Planctomycetaceae bacterium]|nr:hypothetical protein [Planctomycetaceae bacterium]
MSRPAKHRAGAEAGKATDAAEPKETPPPVDLWKGIPDHAPRWRWWIYAAVAAVFLAWLAFLVYVALAGN